MSDPSLLVESGDGPGECCQAVGQVVERIAAEAEARGLACDVKLREAAHGRSSAVLVLSGTGAGDLAAAWTGVIQWRCPSALRPHHRRKNWFVQVVPLPVPAAPVELKEDEVTMEAIRAGGPGGQHQNKTASAIRARWGAYAVVVRDERS